MIIKRSVTDTTVRKPKKNLKKSPLKSFIAFSIATNACTACAFCV